MIINYISNVIKQSLKLLNINDVNFNVEKTKDLNFGDFSCNVAMILSKNLKNNPMDIANKIITNIDKTKFKDVFVSKPGFINFICNEVLYNELIKQIINQKNNFPMIESKNLNYNLEFVSANPTGLLHIGHARNAVFGDILANILKKYGINVIKEYLINDAGNQMNKLSYSTLIRYKQLFNLNVELVDDSYHGTEIIDCAKSLKDLVNDKYLNVECSKDGLILDKNINEEIRLFACNYMLNNIKEHLSKLGIKFDIFFSEKNDHQPDAINSVIKLLKNHTYQKDDALWLETIKLGDDKDRVLIKSNNEYTYFLPDIAYHLVKLTRNHPDKIINIWGADHHSYIKRMSIALEYLGYKDKMDVICMQMVRIIRDGKEIKLSKRTGESLTLIDLYEMIGYDACRWFLVSSNTNSHIEIDINLAQSNSNNNPIYYVQYAHARANTLLLKSNIDLNKINSDLLILPQEKELLNSLAVYKLCIENAAISYEPSKITNYLLMLTKIFHNFYTNINILNSQDKNLINQRLLLVYCVKQVIKNSLSILGIEAKEKM